MVTAEVDAIKTWEGVLKILESQLNRPTYEAIVGTASASAIDGDQLIVATPNTFYQQLLTERYQEAIQEAVVALTGGRVTKARFIVVDNPEKQSGIESLDEFYAVAASEQVDRTSFLNPRYTFDTFVMGQGNRLAHAAALAVAEAPGKSYNPLFVYGGVGLGKTHLMQAVGHAAARRFPRLRVCYLTSEKFTNELIESIQKSRMEEFQRRYRSIDILMIDDIQFIAGKEKTQEEFFHTFNTLYEAGKQIILSSDRPPKEILTLEERLRSRFEWGLIADIQPPDLETRIAILKKKAEIAELVVDDPIFLLIAERITSNIRQLEGALLKIAAYTSLDDVPITPEIADEVLRDTFQSAPDKPPLSINLIKKTAADYYSIRIDDMNAKIRTREIATARQVAMYLSRELTSASLPKIGEEFGGRDHTTVIHACEKIKNSIPTDMEIAGAVKWIGDKLSKHVGVK